MPTTKPEAPQSPHSRRVPDALERLYVYWLISVALLTLTVVVVAITTHGTLKRQSAVIDGLAEQTAALQRQVRELSTSGDTRDWSSVLPTPAPPDAANEGLSEPPDTPTPASDAPHEFSAPQTAAPATSELSDDAMRARLDEIVGDEPATPADVAGRQAAGALLEIAAQHAGQARWSGGTWLRLAVLARLLAQDALAVDLAARAAAAGEPLAGYATVSARALLVRGRAREALEPAQEVVRQNPKSATARILLAAALLKVDDPASADEVLEHLPVPVIAHSFDKLLLARVFLELEHWERLEAVLSTVPPVPAELVAEYSLLLATTRVHNGQLAEALAILDGLAADAGAGQPGDSVWPWPRLDRYEIEVWRGVAYLQARQLDDARQILQEAAARDPGRPAAQYHLALLEAASGRPDVAKMYLKNALAGAPRMIAAHEALATFAINDGEINLALQHLSQAVSINFRRAPAHFLMAIAHAKVSQKGPAAEALRITFHLDGGYLADAKQIEVLLNLFTEAELDALAEEAVPA
jgi:tetratricopeptide (TPR) repeat protein